MSALCKASTCVRYAPLSTLQCPIDNRTCRDWPYEQVMLGRRHVELGNAARDLALAFHLTGEAAQAQRAAEIPRLYAGKYLHSPHDDKALV